jgi:hypothetical protein
LLDDTFEPGATYELSLAVGVSSIQPPTALPGEVPPVLRIALTYTNDAGARHEAGGLSVPSQGLRSSQLSRHTLRVTVPAAKAPFTARPIGILITTAPNAPGHDGHFVFDDVRLDVLSRSEKPRPPQKRRVSQRSNGR